MRTWITILCASVLFFTVGNFAAASTYFPDDPAATDDLHGPKFQTVGVTFSRVGDTFTFVLHTNFAGVKGEPIDTDGDHTGDVTWQIYYADLLFDTSMPTLSKESDKSWDMSDFHPDYGVVFYLDGGGIGTNPASPLTTLSVGFYKISSTLTANQYIDSYTNPKDPTYDYPTSYYNQNYFVKIGTGVLEENLDVNTSSQPGNPGKLARTISFTITDPTILAAFNDGFTAFWGTGTCGNDGVVAVVDAVPVPPSLLLMGSGLLSMLGFTVTRRFRSGGRRRKNV